MISCTYIHVNRGLATTQVCAAQIDICADPACSTAGEACATAADCCVATHACAAGACTPPPCGTPTVPNGTIGCACGTDEDCLGVLGCALNGPNKDTCQVYRSTLEYCVIAPTNTSARHRSNLALYVS